MQIAAPAREIEVEKVAALFEANALRRGDVELDFVVNASGGEAELECGEAVAVISRGARSTGS